MAARTCYEARYLQHGFLTERFSSHPNLLKFNDTLKQQGHEEVRNLDLGPSYRSRTKYDTNTFTSQC